MSVEYREVLKALALGMDETAEQLNDQIPDDADHYDLVAALFALCIGNRFREDFSSNAVDAFICDAQRNFADAQPPLKPLAATAMVKATVDPEKHGALLDEVDATDFLGIQFALIRKVVAESVDLQRNMESLLDDAEKVAAAWAAED